MTAQNRRIQTVLANIPRCFLSTSQGLGRPHGIIHQVATCQMLRGSTQRISRAQAGLLLRRGWSPCRRCFGLWTEGRWHRLAADEDVAAVKREIAELKVFIIM